jgi:hypothetical protein
MKIYIKVFLLGLLSLTLASSCSDFTELNTNPDATTVVTPAMLATGQLKNLLYKGSSKDYFYDMMVSKMVGWTERQEQSQYNYWDQTGFGAYTGLISASKMIELASESDREAYTGLFLFIKAYELFDLSMYVGAIPYAEALQGAEGLTQPKYDSQKDVMRQILADLDEAYSHFSAASRSFSGDIYYNGDPAKWKKAVTALQLKILIHLSKKESDSDLNVKSKFATLVSSRELFSSNSDNLQLVYSTEASKLNPCYKTINQFQQYASVTGMVIEPLKQNEDYRLFYYVQPAQATLEDGVSADSFDAYLSFDPSDDYTSNVVLWSDKKVCNVNLRFYEEPAGQPTILLGYAEQQFILAEAALRGWISGNANDFYLKGIEGSMKFASAYTPDKTEYHQGRKLTDDYISSFIAKPSIQLTGTFASDLEKIILQKYLDNFMHLTYESYFTFRRTGLPELPVNPATNMNVDAANKMPMRWRYTDNERSYNNDNLEQAIRELSPADDNINSLMWILQ